MKNKIKKILALILCLALVMSFAGCGNKGTTSDNSEEENAGTLLEFEDQTANVNGDKTTSGDNDNSGNGANVNTDVNTQGGGKVEDKIDFTGKDPFANIPKRLRGSTVTFAHFGDEGADEYQKVFKAFTKKTGIKVNLVSFDQAGYISQVTTQINGHNPPDVIICNNEFPSFLGIAQPLNDILNLNDSFWDKEITDIGTVNGKSYFVNSMESVWENIEFGVYNKRIFSDYSIKTPTDYWNEGQWTFENMKVCIDQVAKTGNVGGYIDPENTAAALGSPIVGYDVANKKFTNGFTEATSAYQLMAKVLDEGGWNPSLYFSNFSNGKIGLFADGGVFGIKYNGYYKDTNPNDLACFPAPTSYKGKTAKYAASIRGYGIAKGSKNPEGAAYLIRYFLDYNNYKDAGANVFMNKSVEKFYFDTIVPDVKKRGRVFNCTNSALILAGDKDALNDIEDAKEAQVPSVMSTKNNIVNNAVDKMNSKLNSYK